MTNTADLLELIDTTVTLEWGETRTIGTLVGLGGRTATLTALRAPPERAQVFMRIENEDPSQSMALDGTCMAVTNSDWGEQQVEVALARVGTTASAAALRDFIERHGIERGGTVSVGRNRDNPDLRRYVYALPETAAQPVGPADSSAPSAPTASAGPSVPAQGSGAAAKWSSTLAPQPGQSSNWAAATSPAAPPSYIAPAPSVPQPARSAAVPSLPQPAAPAVKAAAAQPVKDDLAAAWEEALQSMDATAALDVSAAAALPGSAPAVGRTATGPQAEPTFSYGKPVATPAIAAPPSAKEHDESEQILVNIVDAGSQASPVFGMQRPNKPAPAAPHSTPSAVVRGDAGPAGGPGADKATHATDLFGSELSVRLSLTVQFEAGPKKRKHEGKLLRLSESKLRISTQVLPESYERIAVYVPGKLGMKDALVLQCEVTRVHRGEADGSASFDARLTTAGNPAGTMVRLRQLVQDQGGGAAP